MSEVRLLTTSYDSGSDVLYLSRRRELATRGVEDGYGILWRYARSGDLIGATIMDLHEQWEARQSQLVEELSRRFEIPAPEARVYIEEAMSRRSAR